MAFDLDAFCAETALNKETITQGYQLMKMGADGKLKPTRSFKVPGLDAYAAEKPDEVKEAILDNGEDLKVTRPAAMLGKAVKRTSAATVHTPEDVCTMIDGVEGTLKAKKKKGKDGAQEPNPAEERGKDLPLPSGNGQPV